MLVYMLPFCNSDTPVMNRYSLISIRELAMWTTKLVSIIGRRLNGFYEAEKFQVHRYGEKKYPHIFLDNKHHAPKHPLEHSSCGTTSS